MEVSFQESDFEIPSTAKKIEVQKEPNYDEIIAAKEAEIIKLKQEVEEWKVLAGRDVLLTEFFNKREGDFHTERLIAQVERNEISLALIRFDIDDFKGINDAGEEKGGHRWGDTILKEIAEAIINTKRETDIPIRFGGDELDVLLPLGIQVHPMEAAIQVHRFLDAIHKIYRYKHKPDEVPKDPARLTSSIGVAFIMHGEQGYTVEQLQEMADICAFQAKKRGRDTIVSGFVNELEKSPDNRTFFFPNHP